MIEVRGVSKRYRLGQIGLTSLRAELERWWQRRRGVDGTGAAVEDFWALRDVSFDVQPGEVMGIIGRNGAGKSTLLKILSEITEPTEGEIRLRGRTASLLEVGTGFHPELSGRENVFLNGAILGMRRAEIVRKFDEIVAFAEVDQFIDTPVKRYSSGMYVRLAFAVAAHLEPEILVVDEVLAVGDHAFQQKCLGKMQDVAQREGRTVLFVSHNMAAVTRLCDRAVHLARGGVAAMGPARKIVGSYLAQATEAKGIWIRPATLARRGKVTFSAVQICNATGAALSVVSQRDPIRVALDCQEHATTTAWVLRVSIYDREGNELLAAQDVGHALVRGARPERPVRAGCTFPGALLRPGEYTVGVSACELAGDQAVALYEEIQPVVSFEVSPEGFTGSVAGALMGVVAEWNSLP